MKITAIMSTYNERDFLPLKIQWCKYNDIDLYVCDNMSTDGSWEIIKEAGIQAHQYDTKGIFSESRMQQEIYDTLVKLNPHWVIYMGCDLFFDFKPVREHFLRSYNVIRLPFYSARYTGETRTTPFNPFDTFRYVHYDWMLDFIFRWDPGIIFNADDIIFPYQKDICIPDSLWINYGDTKPAEQRKETLMRKEKAWEQGENYGWGSHLREGEMLGWKWDKIDLSDITFSRQWDSVLRIQKQCGLC